MNYILIMIFTISGHPPVTKVAEYPNIEICKVAGNEWLGAIKAAKLQVEWKAFFSCDPKGETL